ncbi:hypothetical protein Bbelb_325940 [Branchiostoma belcheri]|nr:hypothetical protein Bbelb_325940 [Branchiostoma belcheri]
MTAPTTSGEGAPGPIGPQGLQGNQGFPGPEGPYGEKGNKGEPGDPGPRGQKGDRGLQGLPGAMGMPGLDGCNGTQGDAGGPGLPGVDGSRGPPGKTGKKGAKGEPGLALGGTKGVKGDAGRPGLDGLPGPPGLDGLPGNRGTAGDPGLQGSMGLGFAGQKENVVRQVNLDLLVPVELENRDNLQGELLERKDRWEIWESGVPRVRRVCLVTLVPRDHQDRLGKTFLPLGGLRYQRIQGLIKVLQIVIFPHRARKDLWLYQIEATGVLADNREIQDWLDHGVHLDQLVHLASQEARVILETPDAPAHPVFLDLRVIQVKMVIPEHLAHLAALHLGSLEQQAHPAPLVHLDCPALQELKVTLETMEEVGPEDHRETQDPEVYPGRPDQPVLLE